MKSPSKSKRHHIYVQKFVYEIPMYDVNSPAEIDDGHTGKVQHREGKQSEARERDN